MFKKGEGPLEVSAIRGLKASGWSPSDGDSLDGSSADHQQRQQAALQNVLRCVCSFYPPFNAPPPLPNGQPGLRPPPFIPVAHMFTYTRGLR